MKIKFIFHLLLIGLLGNSLNARLVRPWTHEELYEASDLVVIANPIETKESESILSGHGDPGKFQAYATRFDIAVVLKRKMNEEELWINYFRYKKGISADNGALFLSFPVKPKVIKLKLHDYPDRRDLGAGSEVIVGYRQSVDDHGAPYIIYLKKEATGYEPVTGHYDAKLSVKLLIHTGLLTYHYD
jgi:hypothetical protein